MLQSGIYTSEVIPVTIKSKRAGVESTVISQDEEFAKLNEPKVSTLSPAFIKDGNGTITAANASSINDGAAALILSTISRVQQQSSIGAIRPLAKILGYAEIGIAPIDFTIAPASAAIKVCVSINYIIISVYT
jgi:acetyl-CoA C-acetyltransferase